MGGNSPSPSLQDTTALLTHVPGRAFSTDVLRFQQDSPEAPAPSGPWLGPDGSVYKRVAIVAVGFTIVAVLILLLQPGYQPAMCREFVPQVGVRAHTVVPPSLRNLMPDRSSCFLKRS